jgi:hypothetical protein
MPTKLPIKHECMWPTCHKLVPLDMWGCREHWYRLPSSVRVLLGRAYRRGMNDGNHPNRRYVRAHHTALAWAIAFESGRPLPPLPQLNVEALRDGR